MPETEINILQILTNNPAIAEQIAVMYSRGVFTNVKNGSVILSYDKDGILMDIDLHAKLYKRKFDSLYK
jgi:hypothetical protein